MLRLQCMHCWPITIRHCMPTAEEGSTDPMNSSVANPYYMGKVGLDEFIPYVVKTYMDDVQSVRCFITCRSWRVILTPDCCDRNLQKP